MDLTVQIITKNQQDQLKKTLTSIRDMNIIVNDLNSTDDTIFICQEYNVQFCQYDDENRSNIRNKLSQQANTQWHMYLEPGETILKGQNEFKKIKSGAYYLSILSNGSLRKEIRIWENKYKFKNPVFETIDVQTDQELGIILATDGGFDHINDKLYQINQWKIKEPLNPYPYYYEGSIFLSLGKINEFINCSEKFMFLEKNKFSIASTMNHYYYSLIMLHKKKINESLKHLNLCLVVNPLMAEFWCLIGDVYYHLAKDFAKAKEFYENAMILGARRKRNDKWPLEIDKYQNYPTKMMNSCTDILDSFSIYQKL